MSVYAEATQILSESDEEPVSKGLERKVYRSFSCDDEQLSERKPVAEIHCEIDDEQTVEREHDSCSDYTELSTMDRSLKMKRWISEEEWMDYLRANPMDRDRFSSDVSIFKVGKFLKDIKKEAYVPQRVSLGPYHHGRRDLPAMNRHKGSALRRMMIRFNKNMGIAPNDIAFASRATEVILQLEDKIRAIYQETIHCDGEMLARMLCLDGCFLLEVLRTLVRDRNDPNEKNDPIFWENKAAALNLLKDILMLENQIPWIVLLELLRLEQPMDEHVERLLNVLVEGTCGLFKFSGEDKSALMQWDWPNPVQQEVHHLLGFLHKVIVHRPSSPVKHKDQADYRILIENCIGQCLIMLQDKSKASNDIESIPPAVELKHAGIKFRPCKGGIKEINFDPNSATIYLPELYITYDTEVLFRNLIAFEICRPSEGNYVTSYAALMNDLIHSEKDAALLRLVGILTNLLGSDKEVADLFNGLCNEGTVKIENVFDGLRKDVNAHYKNKIRIQFAELVRKHFSSPWKALALAAMSFILILTLIKTIFTIISK